MPNRYDVRAEKITTESSDSKSFIFTPIDNDEGLYDYLPGLRAKHRPWHVHVVMLVQRSFSQVDSARAFSYEPFENSSQAALSLLHVFVDLCNRRSHIHPTLTSHQQSAF